MKWISFLFAATIGQTLAYPGMANVMDEVREISKRQRTPGSTEMIGDLKTLPDSQLTATGRILKGILGGSTFPLDPTTTYTQPAGGKDGSACRADKCCIWSYIAADMRTAFRDSSGQCTALARGAVRLGFHDAATWTRTSTSGGADGSVLLSNELSRSDNNGLQAIGAQMTTWYNSYKSYGVTMADLIQFGAKVAAVVCPGGPRIRTFVGRVDSTTANPNGLLPSPTQSAQALIDLFAAKTFVSNGLVALLGAHTVSRQQFFNTARALDPQDSTPGRWDVTFYAQTRGTAPANVLKFPSDVALSNYSVTTQTWQLFANNGQVIWGIAYGAEYIRMSMLGVNVMNQMTECTKVLPLPSQ